MSEHRNVTEVPLDLVVDGRPFHVEPGETVTIADEFDYQLDFQPFWEPVEPDAVAASEARKVGYAGDGSLLEPDSVEPELAPVPEVKKSKAPDGAHVQGPAEGEK